MKESRSVDQQSDSLKQRADSINEWNGSEQTEPPMRPVGTDRPPSRTNMRFGTGIGITGVSAGHSIHGRTGVTRRSSGYCAVPPLERKPARSRVRPGHYTRPLTEFGRAMGIDLSDQAIATARAKYPEIEFHAGNLYEYPLPLSCFDAVVAQEVFDHVPDQDAFLGRVHALLKPGGWLALSCTNAFVVDRLAPEAFPAQPAAHIARPLTMRELREMLATRFPCSGFTPLFRTSRNEGSTA